MNTHEVIWSADAVVKSFGASRALAGAQLMLRPGEVHALVGENGAGKSTLCKVAVGVVQPDEGAFTFRGSTYEPSTLTASARMGVGLVFQESTVSPVLTVSENVFISRLHEFKRFGLLDRRRLEMEAHHQLQRLGADFAVGTPVSALNWGQRKLIELARALVDSPQVLFVDEMTAVLDATGREIVLTALRRLSDEGMAVCFVSHHMEEIFALSDRITVMRDGRTVETLKTADATRGQLESLMVGRELANDMFPTRLTGSSTTPVLRVEGLSTRTGIRDVSLMLAPGEILGIGGLASAGASDLLRALAGDIPWLTGSASINGSPFLPKSPRRAADSGVVYLPGERDLEGLLGIFSVRENIALSTLPGPGRPVDARQEKARAKELVSTLGIKTASIESPADSLSGGNRQKVVLAKLMARKPKILLLDNPTRGVDIGARQQIYDVIARLARDEQMAVVLVSEDLPELLGLSTRILVMRSGSISGQIDDPGSATEQDVLSLML